jgi:acylphosphatase
MCRVIVHVSGKVQRNGYRSAASIRAREFNLTGYVMNLPDGRVKIIAEGKEDDLHEFCESLWINDYLIQVEDIQVEISKETGD